MKKKLLQIPTFKSIEEEAKFWDSHDSANYGWEDTKDVKFAKKVRSIYKNIVMIKLDEQTSKAIEKVAKDKGVDTATVGNLLLRERLSELHAL